MTPVPQGAHSPPSPVQRLRSALPFSSPPKPKPALIRVDVVETQASAAREAYLAERLAQIDGWEYNQRPWGPAEMPVPASLPFGRDPRGRVRRRVESVMRKVAAGANGSAAHSTPAPASAPVPASAPPKSAHGPQVGNGHNEPPSLTRTKANRLSGTKRWSVLSLKVAAQEPPRTADAVVSEAPAQSMPRVDEAEERGPPSAFRRWSIMKPSQCAEGHDTSTSQEESEPPRTATSTTQASQLKKNRRWSIQSLGCATSAETTIITHLPERTSSIASPAKEKDAKKRMTMTTATHSTENTLPSPTLSLVSLDIDFDLFGLSSDSQSVKTPPPDEAPSDREPAESSPAVNVSLTDSAESAYATAPDPQLLAERDAWRHEALLLYDQLCYWRLEALERGRERDGWRGAALSAGVQVPPSIAKQLPPAMAPVPVTEAQRREKHIEREREKGRERVREWHLASIERERQEHEAREAERRYAEVAGVTAERRARERRAAERWGMERREMERREYPRRGHERGMYDERRRSRAPAQPEPWGSVTWAHQARGWGGSSASGSAGGAVSAAAADAAAASMTPPPLLVDSWSRRHAGRGAETPRASGWPASESGRERARELLVGAGGGPAGMWGGTWPRRSGTA